MGDSLPPLHRYVSRVGVFVFSAAYFGTHRFHYDLDSARAEGFPDVVVTANLICAYFEQAVRRWSGDPSYIRSLEERSVATAFAEAFLDITGTVTAVEAEVAGHRISVALEAKNDAGQLISTCAVDLFVP